MSEQIAAARAKSRQQQERAIDDRTPRNLYRIGKRDSATGAWEVMHSDGSVTRNGIKLFDAEVPPGQQVEGAVRRDGAIVLFGPKAEVREPENRECPGYINGQIFNCYEEEPEEVDFEITELDGSPTVPGLTDNAGTPAIKTQLFLENGGNVPFTVPPSTSLKLRYSVRSRKAGGVQKVKLGFYLSYDNLILWQYAAVSGNQYTYKLELTNGSTQTDILLAQRTISLVGKNPKVGLEQIITLPPALHPFWVRDQRYEIGVFVNPEGKGNEHPGSKRTITIDLEKESIDQRRKKFTALKKNWGRRFVNVVGTLPGVPTTEGGTRADLPLGYDWRDYV